MDKRKKHLWSFLAGVVICMLPFCMGGCSKDDGPVNTAPVLSVNEARNITRTTALITGSVSGNTKGISNLKVIYSITENDLKAGGGGNSQSESAQVEGGNVTANLKSLKPGTKYYYCLYVESGKTKAMSDIGQFTTASVTAPQLGDVEIVSIGETEITVRCRILDDGGSQLKQFGFQYKRMEATTYTQTASEQFDNGTSDTFTITLENLEPNTTYFIRAFADNSNTTGATGYSNNGEFQQYATLEKVSPNVSTIEGEAGADWLMVLGSITTAEGDPKITSRGFCYSKTKAIPKVTDTQNCITVTVEAAENEFNATINDLAPNTTYYVCAFATYGEGADKIYGYGKVVTYTTSALTDPVLDEVKVSDVTISSATLTCKLTDAGTGNITEKGFCYSKTNPTPTVTDKVIKYEGNELTFYAQLTELEANSMYYVRAYAKTATTVAYSNVSQFYTEDYKEPTLRDVRYTDVTRTSAKVSVTFDPGTGTIIEKGFCWDTKSDPNISTGKKQEVTGNEFELTITGLKADTYYYVRAYAIIQMGSNKKEFYSYSTNFRTLSINKPTVSIPNSSEIGLYSAKVSSSITNYGDGTVTGRGFCWSNSESNPTLEQNTGKISVEGTEKDFSYTMTGLDFETTYYVRSYVQTEVDGETVTNYSDNSCRFTTLSPKKPQLSFSYSEVTLNSATLTGKVTENGDGTITERGFCWSTTNSNPEVADGKHEGKHIIEEGQDFVYKLENLKPGTTYYVRAYAKATYEQREITGYSGYASFTTERLRKATVDTPTISNLTMNSLTASSKVTDEGNTAITQVGFCWTTDRNMKPESITTKKEATKQSDGRFTADLTELQSGTTYYIYSYATNEVGTSYSWYATATTQMVPDKGDNESPSKP